MCSQQDGTEKRTKDTYGPPMGKRLMIFLDDLNMPRMDQYGTQQPIALLKLLIDRKVCLHLCCKLLYIQVIIDASCCMFALC